MSDLEDDLDITSINHLPDEVLEYILSLTSPYRDYTAAKLVSKRWYKIICGVIQQVDQTFYRHVTDGLLHWEMPPGGTVSPVTSRYSHSACFIDESIYVFGGCTFANTTFNDLWRLDLATRSWVRPLATGTYPPPKACASLVAYGDQLVLFGGWSHPFAQCVHQASNFFNQLHTYTLSTNRWQQLTTSISPPGVAGHAASVVGQTMLVFGGSRGHGISCNDLWTLDLELFEWHQEAPLNPSPQPRYGHSQIVLDDCHILVIGGCGGPNTLFSDVWLLTLTDGAPQWWQELTVRRPQNCPAQLWCHPVVQVKDKVVGLSKTSHPISATSTLQPEFRHCRPVPDEEPPPIATPSFPGYVPKARTKSPPVRSPPRAGGSASKSKIHPTGGASGMGSKFKRSYPDTTSESSSQESSSDLEEGSSSAPRHRFGARHITSPNSSTSRDDPAQEGSSGVQKECVSPKEQSHFEDLTVQDDSVKPGPEKDPAPGDSPRSAHTLSPRTGNPAVRPNAMRNRLKQLETLKRYEDKIRALQVNRHKCHSPEGRGGSTPGGSKGKVQSKHPVQHPMYMHTLDISQALTDYCVEWLPLSEYGLDGAPEETILYSLVAGRGELIMFGGVQTDLIGMQLGLNVPTKALCNSLHFITYEKIIR